jgi:hypothetical protein
MAMFDGLFRPAVVFVASVVSSATLGAAEIRIDPSRPAAAGAVLEGKIEAGDFAKFEKFVFNGNNAVEIYLASPGGDLAEAMKIGLLARLLKLSTITPGKAVTNYNRNLAAIRHNLTDPKTNYICASACFFIFVAGIHRGADALGPAILGIHRPFLVENGLKKLNRDQATPAEDRTRKVVSNYLKVMDVPAKYADDMYSVPSGRVRWIRNDEFEVDFKGFIPELKDWVDARCGSPTDREAKNRDDPPAEQTSERYKVLLRCEREAQEELARRAYGDALKWRNGEIPRSMLDGMPPIPPK